MSEFLSFVLTYFTRIVNSHFGLIFFSILFGHTVLCMFFYRFMKL